jgi:hypothetical protein
MRLYEITLHEIDGQSLAVVGYLRTLGNPLSGTECEDEIEFFPWYNGREAGYVILVTNPSNFRQHAIAFFEHRHSDSIHAVAFEPIYSLNPPTIGSIPADHPYQKGSDKTDHSVPYGEALNMAIWIQNKIREMMLAT